MDPSLRLRLLAWYAVAVGSITLVPWLAVSLTDAGLSGSTVAAVMILVPLGNLIAGPVWTWFADRWSAPHVVLRASTVVTALAGLALVASPGPSTMLAAVVVWAASRAPIFPLADALTLRLLGANRRDYGQIRAVGSGVYMTGMWTDGWLREHLPRAPMWLGAGFLVVTAVLSFTLPAVPSPSSASTRTPPWRVALLPGLAPVLAICVLHGVTITTYDALFALHVEQLGHRPSLTGAAVALGVGVEVLVMLQGRRLIDRFGPLPLFALAVASGIPRWLITAAAPTAWLLVSVQALHGLGFGLFWISGVALFSERAPPEVASSAQSLLPASSFGAGFLLSMTMASVVLDRWDTRTLFAITTVVSALATAWTIRVLRGP